MARKYSEEVSSLNGNACIMKDRDCTYAMSTLLRATMRITGLVIAPVLGALGLATAAAAPAGAQGPSLGFGLNRVFASADGIASSCLEPGFRNGVDGRYLRPVLTTLTSIEFTAQAFIFREASTCVDGFPPPDGTYLQSDRVNLLAESFVSTDLRLRLRLSQRALAPSLAIGGGNTWRDGDNLPYVVTDARIPFIARSRIRVNAEGQLLWVQVVAHRYERTYQNFQLVASQSLGPAYDWRRAFSLGIVMEVAIGGSHP